MRSALYGCLEVGLASWNKNSYRTISSWQTQRRNKGLEKFGACLLWANSSQDTQQQNLTPTPSPAGNPDKGKNHGKNNNYQIHNRQGRTSLDAFSCNISQARNIRQPTNQGCYLKICHQKRIRQLNTNERS